MFSNEILKNAYNILHIAFEEEASLLKHIINTLLILMDSYVHKDFVNYMHCNSSGNIINHPDRAAKMHPSSIILAINSYSS